MLSGQEDEAEDASTFVSLRLSRLRVFLKPLFFGQSPPMLAQKVGNLGVQLCCIQ